MKYNPLNISLPTKKEEEVLDIKFKKKKSTPTVNYLNTLLANYHIFHQNLQTFLWSLTEADVDLHKKIEELHIDAALKLKEIGERILALEHQPVNMLATYLNLAEIKESQGKLQPKEIMINILESHKTLIKYFQKTINTASKIGDIKTVDMISRFMKNIEKSVDDL